jgi:hypothetical protein
MAHVSAENRLTPQEIYALCGQEALALKHEGPCAMGVDVGSVLHVVVGFKPKEKIRQICHMARVSSFNDVHDIAQRFNVKFAVVDMEPELRKARGFAQGEPYPVFLCDYNDNLVTGPVWDEQKRLVKVNRTEVCDTTHDLVSTSGLLILPRRCEELELFAKHAQQAKNKEKDSRRLRNRLQIPTTFKAIGQPPQIAVPSQLRHVVDVQPVEAQKVGYYKAFDVSSPKLTQIQGSALLLISIIQREQVTSYVQSSP